MSQYGSAPPPPPAQGGGYGYGGYSQPPSNHLVWAILTTVFCCLPFGIVSIVYAAQVNSKWQGGDQAGALESSEKAKRWAIIAAVSGVVIGVIYGIGAFAVGGMNTSP